MAAEGKGGKTLDERIRLIEDRLDIYNLIASHPPSADTGAGAYTASVWTEDGVFDRGAEFPRPTGRAAIAGGSANPEHHRAIEQGIRLPFPKPLSPQHLIGACGRAIQLLQPAFRDRLEHGAIDRVLDLLRIHLFEDPIAPRVPL